MTPLTITKDSFLRPIIARWRKDRPIVVVARNSGQNGADARRQAVNDLLEVADHLATAGCDIRPSLPSKDEMLELLRCADPIRSKDKNGKSFSNRIVAIDLRAEHGVYVVLSVGTGRKLDENGVQPFVQYLAELVAMIKPCLLFARRLDRITRRAWALGLVMLALTELAAFIGDADFGISPADGIESVLVFFRAQASEEEARKIPLKSRQGMVRETGQSLASGSCPYAVAAPVPPGFCSYRSTERGMIGRRIITFDTPTCRPPADSVAAGLPAVFSEDADGSMVPVDQVANIRWTLQRLGQPTWSIPRIARGLAARSFSTEGLRRTHGPDAVYTTDYANQDAFKVLHSIKMNLDVYETGVMTLGLGVDDVDAVVITDCFPPDGQRWASEDDFARIRRWLLTTMKPARRSSVLSGLPVSVNGVACRLIKTGGSCAVGSMTAVVDDDYRQGRQLSPGVPIMITPATIIEPLVDAIAGLGDAAFALVPFDTADDDGMLSIDLNTARTRLRVLEDEKAAIEAQLLARGTDGTTLQVSGALLARLNTRYNAIADTDEPAARLEISLLEQRRDEHRHTQALERSGIAADRLLALIAALRDPNDTTYRDLLGRTIRNLTIDAVCHRAHRRRWWAYTISFTVRINAGDGTIEVPVTSKADHGRVFDPDALAGSAISRMCAEQVTWEEARELTDAELRRSLAATLGIPGRRLMLPNITDPRLAHLAARVLTDDDITAIAADTGESETLLHRIRDIHRQAPRAVWRTRPRPTIAAWYRLGAIGPVTQTDIEQAGVCTWETARNLLYHSRDWHHWRLTDAGYVLSRCPACGSRRRSPALIPEPDGLICLDCKRDEAGERWPLATYGRYIVVTAIEHAESADPIE